MNSFISNITGGDDKKAKPDQTSNTDIMTTAKQWTESAQNTASNQSEKVAAGATDLMTSAKQWAESAQNSAGNQSEKVAAGATDLLETAKKYGNDGTQAAGEYLKQAKDYLQQYEKKDDAPKPVEKKEESGSGFGADAMKAAGNLFK